MEVMCERIREAHPWITVPLEVEFKVSDKDWYSIKELEEY